MILQCEAKPLPSHTSLVNVQARDTALTHTGGSLAQLPFASMIHHPPHPPSRANSVAFRQTKQSWLNENILNEAAYSCFNTRVLCFHLVQSHSNREKGRGERGRKRERRKKSESQRGKRGWVSMTPTQPGQGQAEARSLKSKQAAQRQQAARACSGGAVRQSAIGPSILLTPLCNRSTGRQRFPDLPLLTDPQGPTCPVEVMTSHSCPHVSIIY